MWRVIFALVRKDLLLVLARGSGLLQAILLGLLLVFVFSLAQGAGERLSPEACATIFWMSSLFGQVLLFNQLYALEETTSARAALLLLPVPPQAIWFAKTATGYVLLLLSQAFFLPAALIFLGQEPAGDPLLALVTILLTDLGLTSLGSLLGAAAQGQVSRESLLSILLFPLITPILLAAIRLHAASLGGGATETTPTLSILLAFDAIFFSVSGFLFSFIYTGEDP